MQKREDSVRQGAQKEARGPVFFHFFLININININIDINNDDDNNDNNGGIAAHCCGIFSCTNPPVWPVGVVVVAELYL